MSEDIQKKSMMKQIVSDTFLLFVFTLFIGYALGLVIQLLNLAFFKNSVYMPTLVPTLNVLTHSYLFILLAIGLYKYESKTGKTVHFAMRMTFCIGLYFFVNIMLIIAPLKSVFN